MNKNYKYVISFVISLSILFCSIYFYLNRTPDIKNYNITLMDVGFDTVISFSSECTQNEFDQYVTTIKEKYTYYNNLFDQYHAYDGINNVYTINHDSYKTPVSVDPDLIECIQISFEMNKLNSKFDITQGNLLSLWHTYRSEGISLNNKGENGHLPSNDEILSSLSHFGTDKVRIKNNTIQLLDSEMTIDLGGIAKGYATQKVKEELIRMGCKHGFINAGGNIVLIGNKTNGDPWSVGVQDPDSGSSLLAIKLNKDKSIVTSGDYQRFYTVNNEKYTHIIDPSTGYPAKYLRSVTVICNDSAKADALSTTLFCMSYTEGLDLIKELKKNMDVDAIWIINSNGNGDIEKNGFSIFTTSDIKKSIQY